MPTPRLLVCDDVPEVRALYQLALEDEGYGVTLRPEPPEDPNEVAAATPDLIVLELLFGGDRRGLRAIEALKRDPLTASIPVLVCTAAPEVAADAAATLDALDAAVLLKPFDLDDLFRAIEHRLGPLAPALPDGREDGGAIPHVPI
jgi:two-component system response regulator MprA